jgi:molybdopterin synthase catalytic subunit
VTAWCRVVTEPIRIEALLEGLTSSSDGAALLFLGVVRDHNEGLPVSHLEYDAYLEMAERTLSAIADEARQRWDTGQIRVVHRVGRLAIGETSVVIAVASAHRDAAYSASRYVIEELKRRAPIWKREGYASGATAWLGGVQPAGSPDG